VDELSSVLGPILPTAAGASRTTSGIRGLTLGSGGTPLPVVEGAEARALADALQPPRDLSVVPRGVAIGMEYASPLHIHAPAHVSDVRLWHVLGLLARLVSLNHSAILQTVAAAKLPALTCRALVACSKRFRPPRPVPSPSPSSNSIALPAASGSASNLKSSAGISAAIPSSGGVNSNATGSAVVSFTEHAADQRTNRGDAGVVGDNGGAAATADALDAGVLLVEYQLQCLLRALCVSGSAAVVQDMMAVDAFRLILPVACDARKAMVWETDRVAAPSPSLRPTGSSHAEPLTHSSDFSATRFAVGLLNSCTAIMPAVLVYTPSGALNLGATGLQHLSQRNVVGMLVAALKPIPLPPTYHSVLSVRAANAAHIAAVCRLLVTILLHSTHQGSSASLLTEFTEAHGFDYLTQYVTWCFTSSNHLHADGSEDDRDPDSASAGTLVAAGSYGSQKSGGLAGASIELPTLSRDFSSGRLVAPKALADRWSEWEDAYQLHARVLLDVVYQLVFVGVVECKLDRESATNNVNGTLPFRLPNLSASEANRRAEESKVSLRSSLKNVYAFCAFSEHRTAH